MTFEPADQIEHFLSRLELKLQLPKHRKQEVVDELRSDLLTQRAAHLDGGRSEQEAQQLVLDSIGDPDQLAAELSSTVAPTSGGAVRIVRYVIASGIIVWALVLLWTIRAWSYGFSPLQTGGILALHLALTLVVWPGIIWRSNWLYGLIPAGVCVAFLLAFNAAGISSSQTIDLSAPPEIVSSASDGVGKGVSVVLASFVAIAVYLIVAMQQRRQRWRVAVLALLAFGVVESTFLLEEVKFRAERDRLVLALRNGDTPGGAGVRIDDSGEHLSLYWKRKLCPGFTIAYSSAREEVWIND